MKYTYTTSGTCSRQIDFEIDGEGKIGNVNSPAAVTAIHRV